MARISSSRYSVRVKRTGPPAGDQAGIKVDADRTDGNAPRPVQALGPAVPQRPRSPSPGPVRRATPATEQVPVVQTADFRVDLAAKQVTRNGREIRLTPTEWQLVEVLVRHPGPAGQPAAAPPGGLGPHYGEETNYLRVFVAQIRRKLEPDPAHPRYFITEPGIGYRFQLKGGSAGPT